MGGCGLGLAAFNRGDRLPHHTSNLDAFRLPFRYGLSVFDKAVDQQILKLHDPGSLLWG